MSNQLQSKIPQLDGFRALAILLVINFHFAVYIKFLPAYNSITGSGWIGVSLFFMLSSFLLILPYIEHALSDLPVPSYKNFYRNRILRIFPLYFFSMICFLIIHSIIGKTSLDGYDLVRHVFFLHNFQENHSAINPPYWSLAVEIHFYLLCPLIGLMVYKLIYRRKIKLLVMILSVFIILSIGYRIYITQFYKGYETSMYTRLIYASTLANFEAFVFGILNSLFYALVIKRQIISKLSKLLAAFSIPLLLIGLYILMDYLFVNTGGVLDKTLMQNFCYTLLYLLFSGFITASFLSGNSIWNKILGSKIALYLSAISFSLYIWHYWMYAWMHEMLLYAGITPGSMFNYINLALASLLTLLISHLTYYYFELPILRLKKGHSLDLSKSKLEKRRT